MRTSYDRSKIQPYILLMAFVFYFFTIISKSINTQFAAYNDYVIYIAVIMCIATSRYINMSDIKHHLRYFIIFMVYGIFSLTYTKGGVGSLLGYVFPPLYLCAMEKLNLTRQSRKAFCVLFVAYICVLSIFAKTISENYSWTLNNYISPNSYWLTCSFWFIYVTILLKDLSFRYKKSVSLILFILTIYSTYLLDTRMAMYVSVLFFVLNWMIPKRVFSKKRMMIMIILLIILTIVFPIIYVNLYAMGIEFNIPFTQKSLYTGRERLWTLFFSYMGEDPLNWLLGVGSKVPIYIDTGRSQSQHLHNNMLAIITTFGILGALMTYSYILKNIKRIMNKCKEYDENLILCLTAFMCFLLEGLTENSMVGVSLFPFFSVGILLDKNNKRGAE